LQAKLLEFDSDSVLIERRDFHDYLLSVHLPVKPTVDRCRARGWIEDADVPHTIIFDDGHNRSEKQLQSSPGYRILQVVNTAVASVQPTAADSAPRANDWKIFPKGLIGDQNLADLAIKINTEKGTKSLNAIARDFFGETKARDPQAQSALAQLRRLRREGRVKF
jgi:hypothetical protein